MTSPPTERRVAAQPKTRRRYRRRGCDLGRGRTHHHLAGVSGTAIVPRRGSLAAHPPLQLRAQALARARAYDEQRTVALALQRSLLGPTDLPAGFAARYEPASGTLEVGGDWYDVIALPDGRIGVVVGDVVGRGLPAAAVMGQLRSAGRALLLKNNTPAQVLTVLDKFAALVNGARCSTVFCAVVDPRARTLRYSSAGHPPAIMVDTDGGHRLLQHAQAPPLAVLDNVDRPEADAAVAVGSTVLLYTDGLIERRRESLEEGIDRAVTALVTGRELAPDDLTDQFTAQLVADGHADDMAFLVYRQPASQRESGSRSVVCGSERSERLEARQLDQPAGG